jgi:hypothetical protein
MALARAVRGVNLRAIWLPVGIVAVVAGALIAVIVLSSQLGASDEPPPAPPFAAPAASSIQVAAVKIRDGANLVIVRASGERTVEQAFSIAPGTQLERLQPATVADIVPGDALTVVGIPNEYKNFAVHVVVVLPGAVPGEDGFARSPAGFLGSEATRDPNDRAIISGVVEAVDGKDVHMRGPEGVITVHLEPEEPLYRLGPVAVDGILEGDRIAGMLDAGSIPALLVMPGSGM